MIAALDQLAAEGLLETRRGSGTHVALSITGIAGPGGATAEKPLGLVYFGMATLGEAPRHLRGVFPGDRAAVRQASLRKALALLAEKAD